MNRTIRSIIREADDRYYDPWGTMIRQGFALAEVLTAIDGEIPAVLEYRHGAYVPPTLDTFISDETGEWYYEGEYAQALESGEVSSVDLTHAATVVGRHLDLLRACGRDY